jgi:hypothetical protein
MGILDTLGSLSGTEGNGQMPDIISMNPDRPVGVRKRDVIVWSVPGVGYIQMYVNPQQMQMSEKKVISRQRTKGGYVVQYWGEEPITIKLDGTTGASGVEGINILRRAYRAEQDTYRVTANVLQNYLDSLLEAKTISEFSLIKGKGMANQTMVPTLGALALSVELFYQGWLFRGYFEDFVVTESVSNGVGIFNYSMTFIALEKSGVRNNFMPWHRAPARTYKDSDNPIGVNVADSDNTPMSYKGEHT